MTPFDRIPFAHARGQEHMLRRVPLEAMDREMSRPVMRVLLATLWVLIVAFFAGFGYIKMGGVW